SAYLCVLCGWSPGRKETNRRGRRGAQRKSNSGSANAGVHPRTTIPPLRTSASSAVGLLDARKPTAEDAEERRGKAIQEARTRESTLEQRYRLCVPLRPLRLVSWTQGNQPQRTQRSAEEKQFRKRERGSPPSNNDTASAYLCVLCGWSPGRKETNCRGRRGAQRKSNSGSANAGVHPR